MIDLLLYLIGAAITVLAIALPPSCREQQRLRNVAQYRAHPEAGWPPLPKPVRPPTRRAP
jgi:hypothetical protein